MENFDPVVALENASTTEEEIKTLEILRQHLCPDEGEDICVEDICAEAEAEPDADWLKQASADDGESNPFPAKTPDGTLVDQEELNRFTFYLFERRYGWSEQINHADLSTGGKDVVFRPDSRTGSSGSGPLNIESKFKKRLIELLDDFLKW